MTLPPPPPPVFRPTGRHRLRVEGDRVLLQIEERLPGGLMHSVKLRWRDARPQDVLDLIGVQIDRASLRVGA